MHSIDQGSNGNPAAEPFDEESFSACFPEISDIYEDSILHPRIGEQHQVEIPPVKTKSKLFQLRSISFDDTKMPAIDELGVGLSIPVKWVQYECDNIKIKCEKEEFSNVGVVPSMERPVHLHNHISHQVDYKLNTSGSTPENPNLTVKLLQRYACKVEFHDSCLDNHVANSANHEICDNDQKDYCLSLQQNRKAGGFYPLPGSRTISWSDAERQSFLLGLYIFGKNLVVVKKFLSNKRMGDVLSFYYGKFYRSDLYHRWSDCRKIRSRRSIHGQRIFTGWRQQELLSRILNSAPKELQGTLLEDAKSFNEGRSNLEEFVFKLRAAVGLQVLVEAIGIGKGTYDLTGLALDHVRTNQSIPLHPEIPVGRACSSLTSADIIKFLTGDFRLSKARSNDLFWEAVWPRLLARGWHSEQPKDHGSLGFKNSLVFLLPRVKKFSRKKLVKGTHFFDSVSDVLSKVALEPRLLELDGEGTKCSSSIKEQNGCSVGAKVYQNDSYNHQHDCYLHPSLPSCNSECMKFTVVDTSLVQREKSNKVMEVKSLPSSDATSSYCPSANFKDSASQSSSEDSTDTSSDEDDSNHSSFTEKKPEDNRSTQPELPKTLTHFRNAATTNGYAAPGNKDSFKLKNDKTVVVRFQKNRRVRSGQTNGSAPTMKRRRLTSCSGGSDRRTCSTVQQEKKQMRSKPDPSKAVETLFSDASSFQEKRNLYFHANKSSRTDLAEEDKMQSRTFFDLNNLPPDADITESSSNKLKAEDPSQCCAGKQQIGNQASVQDSNDDVPVDDQPLTGTRRQSMRNRPPTAKALEALASGFIGTKRAWRSSNSTSTTSRKARKGYHEETAAKPVASSSTLSISVAETVSRDYEESARKGTLELLGVP